MHEHKHAHKFNPAMLDRLRDPERLQSHDPEAIWKLVAPSPVSTVVDIGAGIGFFAIPFARHIPAGRVYACDMSDEMLEHLRSALAQAGVSNVTALRSEEVRVPLPDGCADLVFMANLHHELEHPDGSLREARRLLRPGGRIAILDWKPEPTPHGPPMEIRVPVATVRTQLESAGFHAVAEQPPLPYHYLVTAEA